MYKLFVKCIGKNDQVFTLEKDKEYIIGRHSESDIVLDADYGISRKHLKISFDEEKDQWKAECLSSINQILVNKKPVGHHWLSQEHPFYVKDFEFSITKDAIPHPTSEEEIEESNQNLPEEELFDSEENNPSDLLTDEANQQPPQESPEESDSQKEIKHVFSDSDKKPSGQWDEAPSASLKDDLDQDDASKTVVHSSNLLQPTLVISISEHEEDQNVVLPPNQTEWTIGRATSCDVFIEHVSLSRKHFKITKEDQEFFITDLGSANGTTVNGQLLESQVSRDLHSGDVISILGIQIFFDVVNPHFKKEVPDAVPAILPPSQSASGSSPNPRTPSYSNNALPPSVVMGETIMAELPNKKRKKFLFISFALLLIGGISFIILQSNNKPEQEVNVNTDPFQKLNKADREKVESFYNVAQQLYDMKKYELCIEKLNSLHSIIDRYQESKNLLNNCKNGVENIKIKQELAIKAERKKQLQRMIESNITECKKKFSNFRSLEEIKNCLSVTIENDPQNLHVINLISRFETDQLEKERKKANRIAHNKFIQTEEQIYNKAKKLKEENKILQAISAYKNFLKRKHPKELADIVQTAKLELQQMEDNLKARTDVAMKECTNQLDTKNYRDAYLSCIKVLEIIPNHSEATFNAELAQTNLHKELKDLYEDSVLHESLGRVDRAKDQWKTILEKDIPEGKYYTKSKSKLSKY